MRLYSTRTKHNVKNPTLILRFIIRKILILIIICQTKYYCLRILRYVLNIYTDFFSILFENIVEICVSVINGYFGKNNLERAMIYHDRITLFSSANGSTVG